MKVRSIDILKKNSETFQVSGRKAVREAIKKLAAPQPPRSPGLQPGPETPPGGLEDPQNGLDEPTPGLEPEMPPDDQLGGDNSNLVTMVKGIAHKYLSDEQLDEIGEAVTKLIAYVPDQMRKDLVKDFSEYLEKAAVLKATLSSFVLLTTPPRNMEQIFQFPEQQQEGLQSDVLT